MRLPPVSVWYSEFSHHSSTTFLYNNFKITFPPTWSSSEWSLSSELYLIIILHFQFVVLPTEICNKYQQICFKYTNWSMYKMSPHLSLRSLICFLISGVGLWGLRPLTGLLYQPRVIGDCGKFGGMKIGRENWNVLGEKTCPSANFSSTIPTCLDPVLNPSRRGGKPATDRLR
jgi:hypothetical protein